MCYANIYFTCLFFKFLLLLYLLYFLFFSLFLFSSSLLVLVGIGMLVNGAIL